ncbi:acetyl-CoA-acetyltransferase [Penicillium odoratum]|uniref:acetyl-CoA-acetyltransferase n=1 Tax=Penicillium odoratum TaxID=1167516 RepID=UPI0025496271|nr:acetyl-CoA-acetyltransferase [Penicillium odoratum]KAJ5777291.1 acetyl-CoA-acetyltransferase [Penicillium odoratum]
MPSVYIVGATRTPVAKINGQLSSCSVIELGGFAVEAAVKRSKVPVELIDHVYMGHALQAGTGQSPAKQVAIQAGLPATVEATTINKVCASGLKAVSLAAQEIMLGHSCCQVAGGMESMSNVPLYTRKGKRGSESTNGDQSFDGLKDGLESPFDGCLMGKYADQLARRYHISREDMDEYSLLAYERAAKAHSNGTFNDEIIPVQAAGALSVQVSTDIMQNEKSFHILSTLPPAFSATGSITSGSSSFLADGASAVVLVNGDTARKYCEDKSLLAEILSFADASLPPPDFAVAPSKAIKIALERARLTVDQVSLWEINEAFAVVVQVNQEILELDLQKVNINGGAIALGHPLGNSGCRILVSLVHQLKPGQLGVAAICNGGGGATAVVVKRLEVSALTDPVE